MKILHKTSRRCLQVLALVDFLVVVDAAQLRSRRSEDSAKFFAYDYSKHGQEWAAGSCASRSRQSPIDLPENGPTVGVFQYKYEPITSPVDLLNNGHTYSIDLTGLGIGGILYEDSWYNLLNVNIHSLSEHTWQGEHKPLELHLVHKKYDSDAVLIVAVAIEGTSPLPMLERLKKQQGFVQLNTSSNNGVHKANQMPMAAPTITSPGSVAGIPAAPTITPPGSIAGMPLPSSTVYVAPSSDEPNFSPTLQAFLKVEPPGVNMKVTVPPDALQPYNLNDLMQGSHFYEYAGSLTAPPCSETAIWLVRKDASMASDRQVLYLSDAIYKTTAEFGNYRSVMPMSDRVVSIRQGMMEDMPNNAPTAAPPGPPMHSDREFEAMKWAMDAVAIAKQSADYIRNVDMRMRNAAQAHADALAPELPEGSTTVTTTLAPLGQVNYMTGVKEMESTARSMARTLAEVAGEVVQKANKDIQEQARVAALAAAREASRMVATGQGNPNILGNTVSTPAPFIAPIPPSVFQR